MVYLCQNIQDIYYIRPMYGPRRSAFGSAFEHVRMRSGNSDPLPNPEPNAAFGSGVRRSNSVLEPNLPLSIQEAFSDPVCHMGEPSPGAREPRQSHGHVTSKVGCRGLDPPQTFWRSGCRGPVKKIKPIYYFTLIW